LLKLARRPGRGRTTVVDLVYVMTKDGKEIGVGANESGRDIEGAIRRVAARMKTASGSS
jgi:hypothetical protein